MYECKLCFQESDKAVDSHIIPKAFYKPMWESDGKGKPLLLITNTPGQYKSKTPNGIYDNHLVCEKCEQRFSKSDSYAINLLLNDNNFSKLINNQELIGWSTKYNYKLLKFFFLTLLWRAGATDHKFFTRIDLGPHISRLRSLILGDLSGGHQEYSVFLARYEDQFGRQILMDPHKEDRKTFSGLKFYRFYLGAGYLAYIKVDKRSLQGGFEDLFLNEHKDTLFILNKGRFNDKNEARVAIEIFKKNKQLH